MAPGPTQQRTISKQIVKDKSILRPVDQKQNQLHVIRSNYTQYRIYVSGNRSSSHSRIRDALIVAPNLSKTTRKKFEQKIE